MSHTESQTSFPRKILIKRFIFLLTVKLTGLFLKFLRLTKAVKVIPGSYFLQAVANAGSAGDGAVLLSSIEYLRAKGARFIAVSEAVCNICSDEYRRKSDEYIIFKKEVPAFLRYAYWLSKCEFFFALGNDIMDGGYGDAGVLVMISKAVLAEKIGLKVSLINFSINDHPSVSSVLLIKELPSSVSLRTRDPVSFRRVEQHMGRCPQLTADAAFLLETPSDEHFKDLSAWMDDQKKQGYLVVAICPNSFFAERYHIASQEEIAQRYAAMINVLSEKNPRISYVLVAHVLGGGSRSGDARFVDLIASKLLPQVHIAVADHAFPVKSFWAVLQKVDVALSSRMHFTIGCLKQAVPVACIIYQGKFEGLFEHFQLQGMTIDPERAFSGDNLANFFEPFLESKRRAEIAANITSALPRIKKLAEANFYPAFAEDPGHKPEDECEG